MAEKFQARLPEEYWKIGARLPRIVAVLFFAWEAARVNYLLIGLCLPVSTRIFGLNQVGKFGSASLFNIDLGRWFKDPFMNLALSLGKYPEVTAYTLYFLMVVTPLICWRKGPGSRGMIVLLVLAVCLAVFYDQWLSRFGGDIIQVLPQYRIK
jgi:hypothetical protein